MELILSENSEFGILRHELLKIFVDGEHLGELGLLAQQFHDFSCLIKTYQIEKDEIKLGEYLKIEKFAEYLFEKYRGDELVKIAARHGGRLAEIVNQVTLLPSMSHRDSR